MKKIYSFLVVLFALFTIQSNAQLTCNAAFTTQSINASTIKFIPLVTDSPSVYHSWSFNEINGGNYLNYTNAVSPTNTFPTGVFSVKHFATRYNPNGSTLCRDSSIQVITITQGACLLSANFFSYPSQQNYFEHYYSNYSSNFSATDSIRWTFGDGSSSNLLNPTHTFANNGVYNVCLRLIKRNINGTLSNCVSEICKLDTVAYQCNLQAYFQTNMNVAPAPATIEFYNYTSGLNNTDSVTWNFGDGSSVSHIMNPVHIYTNPGVYTTCLYVKKNNTPAGTTACRDTFCKIINIEASCNLLANFTYYRDSLVTVPNSYHFTNTTVPLAATDSIRWSFGDGTFSNQMNPNHAYPNLGTYNVCLRVIKRNANGTLSNCISEKCYPVIVTAIAPPCILAASFYFNPPQFATPLTYEFWNTSVGFSPYSSTFTDSIRWSFGDGTFSNQLNATHTYAQAGTYNVCLRIINRNPNGVLGNCVSEICHTVVATSTLPCPLVASFVSIADTTAPPPSLTVHFINTSIGVSPSDSIRWTFGDGTSSPYGGTHTYAQAGTYNVCLRIIKRNSNGSLSNCISEICHTVIVTAPTTTCTLQANYIWYTDSLLTVALYTVHFTNTSAPLAATDSIRWSFGDGTFSNQVNPNHTYALPGTYTVCLRVIKRNANGTLTNCIREKCYTVVIAPYVAPCNLQVYFASLADSLQSNIYHFTNQSVGYATGDSITWNFGDGTFSNTANPNHTYANAGTYIVCLRIKKNNSPAGSVPCIREFCKTIVVTTPTPCTLVSNFTWYRDSLPNVAANTIHFINTSAPVASTDSIRWTFGDGTTSNQLNPVHVYAQTGTYNVCLRIIKRVNGVLTNCVSEKCYTIIVSQVCNIAANYTWRVDSTNYKNIIFTNTTPTPNIAVTALWTFGDGTSATSWNATHLYAQPGRYYVCLRIQYGTCVSYKCDSITVTTPIPVPTCTQISNYTFVRSNNTVAFSTAFAPVAGVQYTWTFGDGTGALGANATHVYPTVGTYTACLTAYKNNNCASTSCNTIQILPTINCNNITLSITDVRDSLVPNRIKFTAVSNTTATSQQWTITKIPATASQTPVVINTNNPTYMFLDSGFYNVCVRVTYANGCIKTTCKSIYINQNMPTTNTCTLQVYPNPATTFANAIVTLTQPSTLTATVFNSLNIQVAQQQQQGFVGNNAISVGIANLPAGVYIFRLVYGTQVCYATFIKQ
jgi:PKD repeat protein